MYQLRSLIKLCSKMLVLGTVASRLGAQNVVPLCELFKDLASHAGKTVAVRGELYRGSHGLVLVGHGCGTSYVTKGYVWPTSLSIRYGPGSDSSVSAASETLENLRRQYGEFAGFSVTLQGYLRLKEDYSGDRKGGPVIGGTGFGPFNSLPAELVVFSIRQLNAQPYREEDKETRTNGRK